MSSLASIGSSLCLVLPLYICEIPINELTTEFVLHPKMTLVYKLKISPNQLATVHGLCHSDARKVSDLPTRLFLLPGSQTQSSAVKDRQVSR